MPRRPPSSSGPTHQQNRVREAPRDVAESARQYVQPPSSDSADPGTVMTRLPFSAGNPLRNPEGSGRLSNGAASIPFGATVTGVSYPSSAIRSLSACVNRVNRVRVSQYAVERDLHVYPLLPSLVPHTPLAQFAVRRQNKRNAPLLRGAKGGVSRVVPDFVNVNHIEPAYILIQKSAQPS